MVSGTPRRRHQTSKTPEMSNKSQTFIRRKCHRSLSSHLSQAQPFLPIQAMHQHALYASELDRTLKHKPRRRRLSSVVLNYKPLHVSRTLQERRDSARCSVAQASLVLRVLLGRLAVILHWVSAVGSAAIDLGLHVGTVPVGGGVSSWAGGKEVA